MALTVKLVQDLRASRVLVTVCVWIVSTAPVCVSATLALMAQPARTARLANIVSTVIKVPTNPYHHNMLSSSSFSSLYSLFTSLSVCSHPVDCKCVNGRCNDGIQGDGSCQCDLGWRGIYCSIGKHTCTHSLILAH